MADTPLLRPGDTCWRLARADRVALLVDGSRYYPAVGRALSRAERAVWILAWDLDRRMRLFRDGPRPENLPEQLGPFLDGLCRRRRGLHVHVLLWDYAMIYALEREPFPVLNLGWRSHPRVHFRMDNQHPVGASHHQKVVVVDDAVAFAGGFDLSKWRWDGPEHAPGDPRRRGPDGHAYQPFHDAAMAVDGEAAAALGELARQRWAAGGAGPADPPLAPSADPWPTELVPDLRDVEVGIARTRPAYGEWQEVREVARLYLAAIAAARHWLYLENQYLTSNAVGSALAERLAEDHGPEVVIVLPLRKDGWLEANTMDVLRSRLLRRLRAADRYGRLRVCYPYVPGLGDSWVSVHAKVLIMDDELLRVGSANTSNRSMGLDTECDLAVEARGRERIRKGVAAFRNGLLAEHLGKETEDVTAALQRQGSLVAAVDALSSSSGRSVLPLDGTVSSQVDRLVPGSAVIDPEGPVDPEVMLRDQVPREARIAGRRWTLRFAGLVAMLALLAAGWQWTPLDPWLEAEELARWIQGVRGSPWSFPVVAALFVVATLLAVPVTVLIVATSLTFGPGQGFAYAYGATLIALSAAYVAGALLGRRAVRNLAGTRLNRVSQWLARRGLPAIAVVRIVPVAPFTIINLVAGAVRLPFRVFFTGSALGLIPGTLAIAVFADSLLAVVLRPDWENLAILGGVSAAMVTGALLLRRWLRVRLPGKGGRSDAG
ncbi:VTT domain-containing protein [Thiohalorhabdus sp.]|uniref:VTT domain-containing protein n=1 Tax=Thiohalorhabdus sp. TaxID=3094134 RepID=UPI002FC38FC8